MKLFEGVIEQRLRSHLENIGFLHCIAEIRAHSVETKPLRSITLDIITRLFDNAAFVCIHVVARFSKDLSEVRGLRCRGFQLQVDG